MQNHLQFCILMMEQWAYVFDTLKIIPAVHTQSLTAKVDKRSVRNISTNQRKPLKKEEKKLRSTRKCHQDDEKEAEGNMYEPGGHQMDFFVKKSFTL